MVDQVDTLVRSGAHPTPTPFPFVNGRDLVGTVAAAGHGVIGFDAGGRVWCNSLGHDGRRGPIARVVVVGADRLHHLQAGVGPIDTVAVLHTAGTALPGLFREARLRPADTIVIGGAGGVGSAAIQPAAASGRRVIATTAGKDAERCRDSGAGTVVDNRDRDQVSSTGNAVPHGVDVYGIR